MAIYQGNTKISGAGIAIDSALSDSSTNPVQNQAVTNALEDVGYNTWQKPADWIDIRSGALPNSGYFLVGHSADYATYPNWSINASVSNSGTYDVFVDGIKQATTASGTATTLNWQTLALESGWDVTYPTALRTHIVRITPTDNANKFTIVASSGVTGTLWMHFNLSNTVPYKFGSTSAQYHPALEAITSNNNVLKVTNLDNFVANLRNLVYLPKLDASDAPANPVLNYAFYNARKLKKIHILNLNQTSANVYNLAPFASCLALSSIIFENCSVSIYELGTLSKIKKLPEGIRFYNERENTIRCNGLTSLQDTILDVSPATNCKQLLAQGSSSARCDGIKGITVSNEAPFDGASPQINVAYTGLDRAALINLFKSMPTVSASQVCNIVGTTGAADLTADDLAVAVNKGWTVTR